MKNYLQTIGSECVEVRILRSNPRLGSQYVGKTISGYYEPSAFDKLAADIKTYDNDANTKGIYTTLHACDIACLHRSKNRLRDGSQGELTSDHHITHFLVFPVDIDAERIAGISASEAELDLASEKAAEIATVLESLEIPFLKAMSANGYHILILIEKLENKTENADRFKNLGDRFAAHFQTDTTIYNPSRIWKLYGTVSRKGDNTEERPHRRAQIWMPDKITRVGFDDLEETLNSYLPELAPEPQPEKKPKPQKKSSKPERTLEEWLHDYGVQHQGAKRLSNGSTKYPMDCPFNSDHKAPDAAVIDTGNGWAFKCLHNSCSHQDWQSFKAKVAPELPEKKSQRSPKIDNRTDTDSYQGSCPVTGLPIFQVDRVNDEGRIEPTHISTLANEVWTHTVTENKKQIQLYQHGGVPVAIVENEDGKIVTKQKDTLDHFTAVVDRYARFHKTYVDASDDDIEYYTKPVPEPPKALIRNILTTADFTDLPPLDTIIDGPYFDKDFKLCNDGGYHPENRIYQNPNSLVEIENVTDANLAEYEKVFGNVFCDFPYKDEACDLATTISQLLTVLIKPVFADFPMPFFVTIAPSHGSGKSFETDIITTILRGEVSPTDPLPYNDEEIRKTLFARGLAGSDLICFDNIEAGRMVDSPLLASYGTQKRMRDRILGESTTAEIKNNMNIFLNGNNITLSPELHDRSVFKQLVTEKRNVEREFQTEDLIGYVKEHRAELLSYLVYWIQKWIDADKPLIKPKHRMRYWSQVIGGIMKVNEWEDDFLSNADEMAKKADPETVQVGQVFQAIHEEFGEDRWSIRDVFHILSYEDNEKVVVDGESEAVPSLNLLGQWCDGKTEHSRKISCGHFLSKRVDQTVGNFKLVSAGKFAHAQNFKIVKLHE